MRAMTTCPRCGQRVPRVVGKGRGGPVRHNAHGKPCVREVAGFERPEPSPAPDPVADSASRFRLLMETRTVVIDGVVKVDVSRLHEAAAWASVVEKLEAIGIRVEEIPASDTGWLQVALDGLKRQ